MTTGFDPRRSGKHDQLVKHLVGRLNEWGYEAIELAVDGDKPDIQIRDRDGKRAYVDLKSAYSGHQNFSIKVGTLHTAFAISSQGSPVYIVSVHNGHAFVDTPHTFQTRIEQGPRRPTGNGSNTDWYLARPGGTPFAEFFPPKVHGTEHGAPTDEPPPPPPADIDPDIVDESWIQILPTVQQSRDYDKTGTFTPDPDGWQT